MCCGSAKCAWIATPMLSSCASKPSGQASVMRATGVAFSGNWSRMEKLPSSPNALSLQKKFTDRRRPDEPAEAGNPQREPVGGDHRSLFTSGLEDYAGLAKLRPCD